MAQRVKNPPAMQEIQETQEMCVGPLSLKDPLEKEMTMHSSILAWIIPWTEEPGGYNPWSHKELDTTEHAQQSEVNWNVPFGLQNNE